MQADPRSAPASIPAMIAQQAASYPAETIMRRKDRGIWKPVSWTELAAQIARIGNALLVAEIARGDVAAIISETRPEAAYADLAIQGAGAASVVIHPDEDPDRIEQILHSSGCRLLFVENEEQLDKILKIRERCPALSLIVIFEMKGLREFSDQRCVSLDVFIEGRPSLTDWNTSIRGITPDQSAIVLFSRGSAGTLGRALTHREVSRLVDGARLSLRPGDERLAVLRMADVTERLWGLYLALRTRCVSNYLEGPDTAVENMQELQPTVLGADAEAWAHLHARAVRSAETATRVQQLTYRWALRAGSSGGVSAALAGPLVLHAVRRELGLSKLRQAYVADEPISAPTLDWARCLGISIERIDESAVFSNRSGGQHRPLMHGAPA